MNANQPGVGKSRKRDLSALHLLLSALYRAVSNTDDRQRLLAYRRMILEAKPLADALHPDVGTDLLCLVNYRLDGDVPPAEVAFFSRRVKSDLAEMRESWR